MLHTAPQSPPQERGPQPVVLLHDWLTTMRGGERVLEQFCLLFPAAPIYTLLHAPHAETLTATLHARRIYTSWLQKMPAAKKLYRYYLPLYPLMLRSLRPQNARMALSSSHAVVKSVRLPPETLHVCYLHTPIRYLWDSFDDYFARGQASLPVRGMAHAIRKPYQNWDRHTASRVHRFVVNSAHVQERVARYYGREATVVHPPVDLARFMRLPALPLAERENFYLMVGAFAPNKRVEHAVTAFTQLERPLWIVGSGPTEVACRRIAGPSIRFLGNLNDAAITSLYRRARGFVFPGVDDFGITPLEAQASGTPVIAFDGGGARETVLDGQTGLRYPQPTVDGLVTAIHDFETRTRRGEIDPQNCRTRALAFGEAQFRKKIKTLLDETQEAWDNGERIW